MSNVKGVFLFKCIRKFVLYSFFKKCTDTIIPNHAEKMIGRRRAAVAKIVHSPCRQYLSLKLVDAYKSAQKFIKFCEKYRTKKSYNSFH